MNLLNMLPWQWIQYDFMKTALLAVLLATPMFGLMGPLVINRNMTFFSDSLGHSAFTGIALGVILGIGDPLIAMCGFALLYSLTLVLVHRNSRTAADTTISVFSSTAIALGLVLLSRNGGFQKYSWYMVGDLLSIQPGDLWVMLGAFAMMLVFLAITYNRLLMMSVNEALAHSRGIPTVALDVAFTCMVALVVMVSIRWVGVLMINSLLILPAATARNLSRSAAAYQWLSIGLAMCAGVSGLILSFYLQTVTGATIVLLLAAAYVCSLLWHQWTTTG